MMGASHPQPEMFSNISLERFVPHDHPLRCIRPLIDVNKLRETCAPPYSLVGRPSTPPEQLFLALVAGYVLGIPSERKLVMELQSSRFGIVPSIRTSPPSRSATATAMVAAWTSSPTNFSIAILCFFTIALFAWSSALRSSRPQCTLRIRNWGGHIIMTNGS